MRSSSQPQRLQPPIVSAIRFHAAARERRAEGLYGWVSFVLDATVHLDAVAVRRTSEGCCTLAFPKHRDARGKEHSYVRPLNQAVRDAIEAQVLGVLRRGAHIP